MNIVRRENPWLGNRLWDGSLGSGLGSMISRFIDEVDLPRTDFYPAVDIIEDDAAFKLKADLPGIKKDDVHLEIKDNTLIMSGERKLDHEEKRENYHRIERSYGSFMRSFMLPNNVDSSKVDAKYTDGALEVTLHKKPESKPQGIKIN